MYTIVVINKETQKVVDHDKTTDTPVVKGNNIRWPNGGFGNLHHDFYIVNEDIDIENVTLQYLIDNDQKKHLEPDVDKLKTEVGNLQAQNAMLSMDAAGKDKQLADSRKQFADLFMELLMKGVI